MKRRFSLLFSSAIVSVLSLDPTKAFADPPPPVDVVLRDTPPETRRFAIEFNPALLIFGKVSANLIIVPKNHHALVLSPFYAKVSTVPIQVWPDSANQNPTDNNPVQLPKQTFEGYGGELGYRYYFGEAGPRGFFVGPSIILGSFDATAQNGDKTPYLQYGLAVDVGYEALIVDTVSLGVGAGLQGMATSKSIPNQQFPADLYANGGVRPRLLLSLGWTF